MSVSGVDEAVTQLFLSAASPAKIEIALQALEELEANRQESRRQWVTLFSELVAVESSF